MVANLYVNDFENKEKGHSDTVIKDTSCESHGIFNNPGSGHKAIKDIPKNVLEELSYRRSMDFYRFAGKIVNHLSEYHLQHLLDKNNRRRMLKREELITLSQDIKRAIKVNNDEADEGLAEIENEMEELKAYKAILLHPGIYQGQHQREDNVNTNSSNNSGIHENVIPGFDKNESPRPFLRPSRTQIDREDEVEQRPHSTFSSPTTSSSNSFDVTDGSRDPSLCITAAEK